MDQAFAASEVRASLPDVDWAARLAAPSELRRLVAFQGPSTRSAGPLVDAVCISILEATEENEMVLERLFSARGIPFLARRHFSTGVGSEFSLLVESERYAEARGLVESAISAGYLTEAGWVRAMLGGRNRNAGK